MGQTTDNNSRSNETPQLIDYAISYDPTVPNAEVLGYTLALTLKICDPEKVLWVFEQLKLEHPEAVNSVSGDVGGVNITDLSDYELDDFYEEPEED